MRQQGNGGGGNRNEECNDDDMRRYEQAVRESYAPTFSASSGKPEPTMAKREGTTTIVFAAVTAFVTAFAAVQFGGWVLTCCVHSFLLCFTVWQTTCTTKDGSAMQAIVVLSCIHLGGTQVPKWHRT